MKKIVDTKKARKKIRTDHNEIGRVDYIGQLGLQRQALLDKFRVQVPIVIALAAICQLAYFAVFVVDDLNSQVVINSLALIACANAIALLQYRRMRLFPGSRRYAFILQAFIFSYLLLQTAIIIFRMPYSIPMVSIGAVVGLAATWILNVFKRRPILAPFKVIPSERTMLLLEEMPHLHHVLWKNPGDISKADSIIVDLHADLSADWERALAEAALIGASVYHVKHVSESLTGRVRIDHLGENTFGTLRPNSVYFHIKSGAERIIAVVLAPFVTPLILLFGILIRLESDGPAIFRQERVGFRGEVFTIFKIRTMRPVLEAISSEDLRDQAMTKVGDPRITKLGRFLRSTRIDELPQVFNVIRGDISFIGPRPEATTLSQWYESELDFYRYRHIVRPGITGWAQVNQGHVTSREDVQKKLEYDFYYIRHFSFWLDILIAIKTISIVVGRKGAR